MQSMTVHPSHRKRPKIQPVEQKTPTILCIDDDPEISLTIELRMREYDVRVDRAFHGMQGFWEAMTDRPDVIIMDLAMPRGDGQHILECLKRNQQTADIPVIVLTGMRDQRLPKKLFQLGAAQYLNKPIHFENLIHELGRFVPLRRKDDENMDEGMRV